MRQVTWQEVLARKDLIGGDISSRECGTLFRGPIRDIQEDAKLVKFISPWHAFLDPNCEWEKCPMEFHYVVNKEVEFPHDLGDGRISFFLPYIGQCTISPRI